MEKEVLKLEKEHQKEIIESNNYIYPPIELFRVDNNKVENDTKVLLSDILEIEEFIENKSKTAIVLGKDTENEFVIIDFNKIKNLIVINKTENEQLDYIDTIVASIVYKSKPNEVKFLMIDPDDVELSVYNDLPHLLLPVVIDISKSIGALAWLVQEMEYRYNLFIEKRVRTLEQYNNNLNEDSKLCEIIVVINNVSRLIKMNEEDTENAIERIIQRGNKVGIHMIILQNGNLERLNKEIEKYFSKLIIGNIKDNANISLNLINDTEKVLLKKSYIPYENIKKIINFIKDNNIAETDNNN